MAPSIAPGLIDSMVADAKAVWPARLTAKVDHIQVVLAELVFEPLQPLNPAPVPRPVPIADQDRVLVVLVPVGTIEGDGDAQLIVTGCCSIVAQDVHMVAQLHWLGVGHATAVPLPWRGGERSVIGHGELGPGQAIVAGGRQRTHKAR